MFNSIISTVTGAAKNTWATCRVAYDKGYDYCNRALGETESIPKNVKRISPDYGTIDQYRSFFSGPTEIIDNIYVGSAFNAANYGQLDRRNIGLIINVTREISSYYPDYFVYRQYPIYDDNKESIMPYFDQVYTDIVDYKSNPDNCGKGVLIHCYMGASRSVTVLLYYLIKNKRMKYDEAVEFIRTKRGIINPSLKFADELRQMDQEINTDKTKIDVEGKGCDPSPV